MATGLRFIPRFVLSSSRIRANIVWSQPKTIAAPALTSLAQRRHVGGMPQLDVVTYASQYTWTVISLFTVYAILVNSIMPTVQKQLGIRAQMQQLQIDEEKTDVVRPEWQVLRSLFAEK